MKRIEALDLSRVLAMLAVVMIHVTSTYIHADSGLTLLGMNLAFFLNQAARFAVPLFVLLSGVSLGLSRAPDSLGAFYRRRFTRVVPPYLFWSMAYLLYDVRADLSALTIGGVLRALLLGQPAPHLYFIVILLQLYLLYPLLRRCTDRFPGPTLLLSLLVTYGIQKLFFFLLWEVDLIPGAVRPYLWLLLPTWLAYFTAGMVLARTGLAQVIAWAQRYVWPILLTTGCFVVLYALESRITGSIESIKPGLLVYVPLALLCSLGLWRFVGACAPLRRLTGYLARRSMTVYFCHVFVIYGLSRVSLFRRGMSGMLLLYAAVVVIAVPLAAGIDRAAGIVKNTQAFSRAGR